MSVNLYDITVGAQNYYYTSGEFDVHTALHDYIAKPMSRSDLSFSIDQTELTLTVPADLEPFNLFKYSTPLLPFQVQVISHPSLAVFFDGIVKSVAFDGVKGTAVVKLGATKAVENSAAPSRSFGVTCSYELFSGECGINSGDFDISIVKAEVTQNSDTELQAPLLATKSDGYFTGGYVQTTTGESQYITGHIGEVVTLLAGLLTFDDSTSFTFVPGCDKGVGTCDAKFNNEINFGGFPYIPISNISSEGF